MGLLTVQLLSIAILRREADSLRWSERTSRARSASPFVGAAIGTPAGRMWLPNWSGASRSWSGKRCALPARPPRMIGQREPGYSMAAEEWESIFAQRKSGRW